MKTIDLSVTVGEDTKSPPSTDQRVELTRHRRGPGFWQVTSVNQSLHTGSHVSPAIRGSAWTVSAGADRRSG